MLFETLHLPKIYATLPADDEAKWLYCERLISILEESLTNCVLLVDEQEDLRHAMLTALANWPIKHNFGPRARELYASLWQAGRFVRTSKRAAVPFVTMCLDDPNCIKCNELEISTVKLVLVPDKCACCHTLPNAIRLPEYSYSTFRIERKKAESVIIPALAWEKERFLEKVWNPIFRYAKEAEFVDRNIGGSNNRKQYSPRKNYERTLAWLLPAANDSGKHLERVTIYTQCSNVNAETAYGIWKRGVTSLRKNTISTLSSIFASFVSKALWRYPMIATCLRTRLPYQLAEVSIS